jgi:hypothetical protein
MLALILAISVHFVPASLAQEGDAEETVETVTEESKHTVVHANTLWDLAKHFYKDPFQWRRIYEANKDTIKDPHWIYPNQIFIIPGFANTVRVVKTGQKEPPPVVAPPPPPPPAPTPEPEPAPVRFEAGRAPGAFSLPESLSTRLPEGMTSGQPSTFRFLMPQGWKADGQVVAFQGREVLAAEGDTLLVRLNAPLRLRRGLRFTVFRPSAPTEADLDQKGLYMQKVGVVEAVKKVSDLEVRVMVLRSGGAVVVGDLVKVGE